MSVDIIIPVWNQPELTVKCLETIRANTTGYRLIIIDNGSSLVSWSSIRNELENHPVKVVICNGENKGFVKAVNQGICRRSSPYVVIMNNDTEAVPGWIDKLTEPLKADPKIMLSGPLTTTPESWQGQYPKGRIGWVPRTTGMLAFFCTMFKYEVFDLVGVLDEDFGVGFGADDDYCARVLKKGYKMALVQDLVIPHHHRSTFKKLYSDDTIKQMQSAALEKYYKKHPK